MPPTSIQVHSVRLVRPCWGVLCQNDSGKLPAILSGPGRTGPLDWPCNGHLCWACPNTRISLATQGHHGVIPESPGPKGTHLGQDFCSGAVQAHWDKWCRSTPPAGWLLSRQTLLVWSTVGAAHLQVLKHSFLECALTGCQRSAPPAAMRLGPLGPFLSTKISVSKLFLLLVSSFYAFTGILMDE